MGKITSLIVWLSLQTIPQLQVSHFRDTANLYTIDNIEFADFEQLGDVNKGLNNGVYWIRIEGVTEPSVVRITNDHINEAKAFYNKDELQSIQNERFITYRATASPIYLRVTADREAYIPIHVQAIEDYQYAERKDLLFIGFYFGFVVVIILLNLLYFQSFRDITFFYYSLFLFCVSYGLFIKDGLFFLLGFNEQFILFNEVFIHIAAPFVCSYFTTSYLNLDEHFSWLKRIRIGLNVAMIAAAVIYLITNNFIHFLIMEGLVFGALTFYWSFGWIYIKKNIFTKLFVFAFMLILLSGMNFFVAPLVGLPTLNLNAAHLNKAGGFVEMLMLSFGVFYRMKVLQTENKEMRKDILTHANEIEFLSAELEKNRLGNDNYFVKFNLSLRENEILTLLTEGKSNKEIADQLFISNNTVKYHIKNIYQKMDISSRKDIYKLQSDNRAVDTN